MTVVPIQLMRTFNMAGAYPSFHTSSCARVSIPYLSIHIQISAQKAFIDTSKVDYLIDWNGYDIKLSTDDMAIGHAMEIHHVAKSAYAPVTTTRYMRTNDLDDS